MNFKHKKHEWFKRRLLNYTIIYKYQNRWYKLVEYNKEGFFRVYQIPSCSTIDLVSEYFNKLSACDAFFEGKRIHNVHIKKKKSDHLYLSYETYKSKIAKLEKLIS